MHERGTSKSNMLKHLQTGMFGDSTGDSGRLPSSGSRKSFFGNLPALGLPGLPSGIPGMVSGSGDAKSSVKLEATDCPDSAEPMDRGNGSADAAHKEKHQRYAAESQESRREALGAADASGRRGITDDIGHRNWNLPQRSVTSPQLTPGGAGERPASAALHSTVSTEVSVARSQSLRGPIARHRSSDASPAPPSTAPPPLLCRATRSERRCRSLGGTTNASAFREAYSGAASFVE